MVSKKKKKMVQQAWYIHKRESEAKYGQFECMYIVNTSNSMLSAFISLGFAGLQAACVERKMKSNFSFMCSVCCVSESKCQSTSNTSQAVVKEGEIEKWRESERVRERK